MSKPAISKKSLQHIQEHIMKNKIDWASSDTASREKREFKTFPAVGTSLITGGLAADPVSATGIIWARFNDLEGMTHVVRFAPYWLPEDCLQVVQQVYMHFNEMQGLDHWTNLKPVREAHINKVLPGRLPERD